MKKLVILLIVLFIPGVFALSSQQWINKHNLQNFVKIGTNLEFKVYDKQGKLVNRDPEVGEKFTLSVSDDFVWSEVLVYPDTPLGFFTKFDLSVQNVKHILQIGRKKRKWWQRRGKPIFATYYTNKGTSAPIDTSGWKPQDYHLLFYTCRTRRNNYWQSSGVWDCSWKVHSFTLKPGLPPPPKPLPKPLTTCGNKKCDSNENPSNCAQDCPDKIFCGNNRCDPGENLNNCPEDRKACQDFVKAMTHCGNPWTNVNEHCDPLASDPKKKFLNPYGKTNTNPPSYTQIPVTCKDLGFKGGTLTCLSNCLISTQNCNNNVCGDNICSPGETIKNCAADCLIGPAPSKNVPGCFKPAQPQVGMWKVDKSITLCRGVYKLTEGIEFTKSSNFDCNGARIIGDISKGGNVYIHSDDVSITNCYFENLIVTTDTNTPGSAQLMASRLRSNVVIENNKFSGNSYVAGSFQNSRIKNNYLPIISLYNKASSNEVINNKNLFFISLIAGSNNNKLFNNDMKRLDIYFNSNNNEVSNSKNVEKITLGFPLAVFNLGGVRNNRFINNKIELFMSRFSSGNIIENNKLNEIILYESQKNTVLNNEIVGISRSLSGALISLNSADDNIIEDNLINGDNLGLLGVYVKGNDNFLRKNNLKNNNKDIVVSSSSKNNNFIKNNFLNLQTSNRLHVVDNSVGQFYANNFFGGFSDTPACVDVNNDNICDNAFIISTNIQDKTPSKVIN